MTRIQLDSGYINLSEGTDVPIDLSFSDVKELGAKSGGYSYMFDIEGSDDVIRQLGGYFDIDLDGAKFDRNKKVECTLLQYDEEVFTGYIQLIEIKRENKTTETNSKKVSFKVSVFDEVSNFFNTMGDKELTDLNFSDLAHTFQASTIIASWDNTEGYIYPQYAKNLPSGLGAVYTLRDFKPAIFEFDYWKRIFASNGYQFEFDEATDNHIQLDKRFIPFNGKAIDPDVSQFLQEKYRILGDDEELNFVIDQQNMPNYPSGWLPMYQHLISVDIREYSTDVGSKMELDNIITDSQNQYDSTTNNIENKANNTIPWTFQTSYNYEVKVRGKQFVTGDIDPWGVNFNVGGSARCEVCLSLVIQSLTDPQKLIIMDAGTSVISFNSGSTYNFASGYQTLGVGSNSSIDSSGLFDSGEEIDVHALVFAKYFDANGDPIPFSSDYQGINNLNPNDFGVNVPCVFVNNNNKFVRLEFDVNISDLQFDAVPDIQELVKGAGVDPSMFIPKKIKQRDLIASIAKSYNLIFEPDLNTSNKLIVKTRDKYYDDGPEWDWTDKIAEDQQNNITFLSNSFNRRQNYTYKEDKDPVNEAYQNEYNEVYGSADVLLDNEYLIDTDDRELIYSPTPSINSGLGKLLPAIDGVNPDCNVRVLYNQGKKTNNWNYQFYDDLTINQNELILTNEYHSSSMYDDDTNPNFSLLFNSPKALFHDWQQTQTSNYLYNLVHKRELTTINKGSMLIAYFKISPSDFKKLSRRLDWRIYIRDNGWFYISKIHKYNANKSTLTKVELVSADDESAVKFIKPPNDTVKPSPSANYGVIKHNKNVNKNTNIIISKQSNDVNGVYNIVVGSDNFVSGNKNLVNASNAKVLGDNNTVNKGASGSIILTSGKTITTTGTYSDVINTGQGRLIYKASLTQVGTNAPTQEVIVNKTGSEVTWSRLSEGIYRADASGAFLGNVEVNITQPLQNGYATARRVDGRSDIQVETLADDELQGEGFHYITVYKYD